MQIISPLDYEKLKEILIFIQGFPKNGILALVIKEKFRY
jgi:hypothetical protein